MFNVYIMFTYKQAKKKKNRRKYTKVVSYLNSQFTGNFNCIFISFLKLFHFFPSKHMVLLEQENIYLQAFILGKSWYLPQLIFPSSQKLSCPQLPMLWKAWAMWIWHKKDQESHSDPANWNVNKETNLLTARLRAERIQKS